MNEEARKLYEESIQVYKGRYHGKRVDWWRMLPMPTHVVFRLLRAGFGISSGSGFSGLDRNLIKDAVLDGSIWSHRHIGKKSVECICEWLTGDTNA